MSLVLFTSKYILSMSQTMRHPITSFRTLVMKALPDLRYCMGLQTLTRAKFRLHNFQSLWIVLQFTQHDSLSCEQESRSHFHFKLK